MVCILNSNCCTLSRNLKQRQSVSNTINYIFDHSNIYPVFKICRLCGRFQIIKNLEFANLCFLYIKVPSKNILSGIMYRVLCLLIFAASSLAFRPEHFVPFILNGEDADVGEWPHQVFFLW